ncbi:hypothetical protein Tco_0941619 [Tanacetum coccineum]|uniref:Uncharacterized protein n=1 Tax=Tanacetum coccineum TaxID=301880 RepID=A0ABQ5DY30_9ASTR
MMTDDEESSIPLKDIIMSELPPCVAITPALYTDEPALSLIIEDEHLDTIPEMESDEFIKSSVENSSMKQLSSEDVECEVVMCNDVMILKQLFFRRFPILSSTILPSSDDESSYEEDVHELIEDSALFLGKRSIYFSGPTDRDTTGIESDDFDSEDERQFWLLPSEFDLFMLIIPNHGRLTIIVVKTSPWECA